MKMSDTHHNDFELLVVEHLHALSRRLTNLDNRNVAPTLTSPLSADSNAQGESVFTSQVTQEQPRINLAEAEQLDGGNLMLPFSGEGEPENWCVFARAAAAAASKAISFTSVGRIETALPLDELISAAFRVILDRGPDVDELAAYEDLINERRVTRSDFLKMLVCSDETQTRSVQLLIVPFPSRWLGSVANSNGSAARTPHAVNSLPLPGLDPNGASRRSAKSQPIILKFGGG